MTGQIRASVIEPVGGHGGMDFYDYGLCTGLVRAGVKVTLYTCDETRVQEGKPFRIILAYRNIFSDKGNWLKGLKYIKGSLYALMGSVLNRTQICHLHFFHISFPEFFNVFLAKILGIRVVVTAHDIEPFASELSIPCLVRLSYHLSDRIIAHNVYSQRKLVETYRLPVEKICVIPHGNYIPFTTGHVDAPEARQHLAIPEDATVLLFFGQIKRVKGLDLLLQALPEVVKSDPNVFLVVAGKPWKDDYSAYRQIIEEGGLQNCCMERIHYIPNEEVPVYFASADLVVLPYRRIYQSGVLLMAMSYAKPVLASDIDGMREIIRDHETGFLFRHNDVRALSNRILQVLQDRVEMDRVALNGFRYIRSNFNWDRIGALTAECYSPF